MSIAELTLTGILVLSVMAVAVECTPKSPNSVHVFYVWLIGIVALITIYITGDNIHSDQHPQMTITEVKQNKQLQDKCEFIVTYILDDKKYSACGSNQASRSKPSSPENLASNSVRLNKTHNDDSRSD